MGYGLRSKNDVRQKGDDHYESYQQRYAKDVVKPFFFVRFEIKHYGARITYAFCHCKVLLKRF